MSNINLKTIGSLPLAEEVNENTSLVGWDGEKTVRVAKDMVGTSDAVQYIPQELTEEQQMQARKNLGVYWKGKTTQTVYNGVLDQTGINGDGTKAMASADDYSRPNVLEAGKRYSVTVNGETFDNLLCVEGTEMDGLPACFLGNMSICRLMANPPNEDDNGLPFGVMSCEYVTSVRCLVDKDPDDYFESTEDFMKDTSVKIEGVSESITTIPSEYLPKTVLMIDKNNMSINVNSVPEMNEAIKNGAVCTIIKNDGTNSSGVLLAKYICVKKITFNSELTTFSVTYDNAGDIDETYSIENGTLVEASDPR